MPHLKEIEGLPVHDAAEPMRVIVTNRDIKGAKSKDPSKCAVARACQRTFRVKEARVHFTRIYLLTNDDAWVRYETPRWVRTELVAFDRSGKFEPLEFDLRPVRDRLGTPRRGGTATGQGTKRHPPHVLSNVRPAA